MDSDSLSLVDSSGLKSSDEQVCEETDNWNASDLTRAMKNAKSKASAKAVRLKVARSYNTKQPKRQPATRSASGLRKRGSDNEPDRNEFSLENRKDKDTSQKINFERFSSPSDADAFCNSVAKLSNRIARQADRILSHHQDAVPEELKKKIEKPGYRQKRLDEFVDIALKDLQDVDASIETKSVLATYMFQQTWDRIAVGIQPAVEEVDTGKTNIGKIPKMPSEPLTEFQGGRGSDPIKFARDNYATWIDAGLMDLASLAKLHPSIDQKIYDQIRRNKKAVQQGKMKLQDTITAVGDMFPSASEARDNRSIAGNSELEKFKAGQRRAARKRMQRLSK